MNKFFITAIFSMFFHLSMSAQTTDIINFILEPTSLYVDGDDLYYGLFTGNLMKTKISSPADVSTVIETNGIYRSFFYENELYVTQGAERKISKVDLNQNNPTPVEIFADTISPSGICIQNGVLYYAGNSQISKINLSDPNPVKEAVCDRFLNAPAGICIIGDELFVAEFEGGRISKIDITANNPIRETVVSGLLEPTEVITDGTNLFVSEFTASKVLKINANDPSVVDVLVSNITQPTGLFLDGNDLFISAFGMSKIVKLSSVITSTNDLVTSLPKIELYPNPTSDFIRLTGLTSVQKYSIHNSLGIVMDEGNVSVDQEIDIQHLLDGQYFLTLESGHHIGFVKH